MPEKVPNPTAPPVFEIGGRSFLLRLTFDLIDAIHAAVGIDIAGDELDGSELAKLVGQPRRLAKALAAIVKHFDPTLDEKWFNERCTAEVIADGWNALVEAAIFFTQPRSPGVAAAMRETVEAEVRVIEAAAKSLAATMAGPKVQAAINRTIDQLTEKAEGEIEARFASSVASWPESSAAN